MKSLAVLLPQRITKLLKKMRNYAIHFHKYPYTACVEEERMHSSQELGVMLLSFWKISDDCGFAHCCFQHPRGTDLVVTLNYIISLRP